MNEEILSAFDVLKKYRVSIPKFIRDAICEKIIREYPVLSTHLIEYRLRHWIDKSQRKPLQMSLHNDN